MTRRTLVTAENGSAIIEFALVLPIMIALLAGCLELARAVLVRQVMVETVRGGAGFLARVPGPICQPGFSLAESRTIAAARDEIVDRSGLAPRDVDVSSSCDRDAGLVTLRADARLGIDLLRTLGFGPTLSLVAVHRERRLAN